MGSHSTFTTVPLTEAQTADEALDAAVAEWRDGENYSRSHSPSMASSPQYPMTTYDAARTALEDFESTPVNSFQSAIIPLCSADDSVARTTTRKLTVTASDLAELREGRGFWLTRRARSEFGPTVTLARISALPKARKAVAVATEGKAVTRYAVAHADRVNSHGVNMGPGQTIGETYESQAEARAAAIALVNSDALCSSLVVRAIIVRDTGDRNLVTITRPEPESSEVVLDVTTSAMKPGAKQAAWLVSFSVHS